MLLVIDAHYRYPGAAVAGVGALEWAAEVPALTRTVWVPEVEAYEPGQFYRRELPCLLALLAAVEDHVETIIVDDYTDLGAGPGLGRRLYDATGIPVVGVAKSRFRSAPAVEVLRGGSTSPLFVTAAGYDVEEAARNVRGMAGPHRIPTLLAMADRASRDGFRQEAQ